MRARRPSTKKSCKAVAFDNGSSARIFQAVSNLDLNDLLDGWPHEPGQVKARKIVGRDGAEKIQLRIDLGLIQMELNGRPDGLRPHGFESLLHYHQAKAVMLKSGDEAYTLSEADVAALQQEGAQYYHRYLSLFQLRDFQNVIRDTARNLEMLDFVSHHASDEDSKWALEQFRPYVIMMNTRARASLELRDGNTGEAVKLIEAGKERIEIFYRSIGQPEWIESSNELAFLNEWLREVRDAVPLTPLELMERDLKRAIDDEAYERAAELRDAIRSLRISKRLPGESIDH
jgi:UvrB/UvrC motif-containing protein